MCPLANRYLFRWEMLGWTGMLATWLTCIWFIPPKDPGTLEVIALMIGGEWLCIFFGRTMGKMVAEIHMLEYHDPGAPVREELH